MWDFQYRVSMDTYEQLNSKLKTPPVVYELVDVAARPGLLRRLLQAVRGVLSERRLGTMPRSGVQGESDRTGGAVIAK